MARLRPISLSLSHSFIIHHPYRTISALLVPYLRARYSNIIQRPLQYRAPHRSSSDNIPTVQSRRTSSTGVSFKTGTIREVRKIVRREPSRRPQCLANKGETDWDCIGSEATLRDMVVYSFYIFDRHGTTRPSHAPPIFTRLTILASGLHLQASVGATPSFDGKQTSSANVGLKRARQRGGQRGWAPCSQCGG